MHEPHFPPKRFCPIVWLLVAALTLPVVPGAAQDQEQVDLSPVGGLTFVDEIELTIANLIVYVTDKKGRAITDLTREDFEIYQDGDPKQISNFKLYTDEIVRSEFGAGPDFGIPGPTPVSHSTAA